MVNCPHGLGRNGANCVCGLLAVNLNTTKVVYTERKSDFTFEGDVYIVRCSKS